MKTETPAADAPKLVKLSSLKANLSREFDGDWVLLPDMAPAAINARSFNFPAYKVARALLNRQLTKKYKGEISEERDAETDAEFGKLYAKYLLRGWRGFDVEYTPEKAMELLPDPEWRPLKEYCEYAFAAVAQVNVEFAESAAKNSGTSSATA